MNLNSYISKVASALTTFGFFLIYTETKIAVLAAICAKFIISTVTGVPAYKDLIKWHSTYFVASATNPEYQHPTRLSPEL